MSGFFDPPPSTGTNRAATQDCPRCEGHRLVQVGEVNGFDVYDRCPECNPAPATARQPVDQARWKTYDR
jgi:hypothetical protein